MIYVIWTLCVIIAGVVVGLVLDEHDVPFGIAAILGACVGLAVTHLFTLSGLI